MIPRDSRLTCHPSCLTNGVHLSSGWADKRGSETRWMEIFLRGGNAWETFQRPRIGDQVAVLD
jgi:hypothetical protein